MVHRTLSICLLTLAVSSMGGNYLYLRTDVGRRLYTDDVTFDHDALAEIESATEDANSAWEYSGAIGILGPQATVGLGVYAKTAKSASELENPVVSQGINYSVYNPENNITIVGGVLFLNTWSSRSFEWVCELGIGYASQSTKAVIQLSMDQTRYGYRIQSEGSGIALLARGGFNVMFSKVFGVGVSVEYEGVSIETSKGSVEFDSPGSSGTETPMLEDQLSSWAGGNLSCIGIHWGLRFLI